MSQENIRPLLVRVMAGPTKVGTHILELRQLFEDGVTANAIAEPLHCCLETDPASEIADTMRYFDFDVVGLKSGEFRPTEAYVIRDELRTGLCGDHKHLIKASDLITNTTPLIEVLTILKFREFIFVLRRELVDAIITRADLQKPAVRILMFGILTLLEMHLNHWIRDRFPQNSWKILLSPPRIESAEKLFTLRKQRNEEIDLVDCLQLSDKKEIIISQPQLVNLLGLQSKTRAELILSRAEALRNKLAHSQDLVSGTTWREIIETLENAESLIGFSEEAMSSAAGG